MRYVFALIAVLLPICELTGWNLDNLVMFSSVALWFIFPVMALFMGLLGGLSFYRQSLTARARGSWFLQRHTDSKRWLLRLCLSVVAAMLLGGGGGLYILGLASMLLPGQLETWHATVVSQRAISAHSPPICAEYLQLQSLEFGRFNVCTSKPRGQRIAISSQANLDAGKVVSVRVKRSVLGVWAVSIGPNV